MDKKEKSPFLLFSVIIPIVLAFLSLEALINSNLIYSYLGSAANIAMFVFPLLTLVAAAVYFTFLFKTREVIYLVYAVISVVVLIAAFALSGSASNAKIQNDFLKHETAFVNTAAELSKESGTAIPLENEELFNIVPAKKVDVISTGKSSIVLFYTLDTSERFECYAYLPDGNYPIAWDMSLTEWSNPLDINSEWYYICFYKQGE